MIDIEKGTITIGNQEDTIDHYTCWWMTPKGLYINLEEAKAILKANEWPIEVLRPVPVAVGLTLYEVF